MKIHISLVALTRHTYDVDLEVPDGTPRQVLAELVDSLWADTDASEFVLDDYAWDKGGCYWVTLPDEAQAERVWTPGGDELEDVLDEL